MNKSKLTSQQKRARRHRRVRAKISGTAERPRLNVFRSLRFTQAQLIDDGAHKTLLSATTQKAALTGDAGDRTGKVAQAYLLGKAIAEQAKGMGVEKIVFDRGGLLYHGRVKAVAEGARDGGLVF